LKEVNCRRSEHNSGDIEGLCLGGKGGVVSRIRSNRLFCPCSGDHVQKITDIFFSTLLYELSGLGTNLIHGSPTKMIFHAITELPGTAFLYNTERREEIRVAFEERHLDFLTSSANIPNHLHLHARSVGLLIPED
jgi:hypothetical protein